MLMELQLKLFTEFTENSYMKQMVILFFSFNLSTKESFMFKSKIKLRSSLDEILIVIKQFTMTVACILIKTECYLIMLLSDILSSTFCSLTLRKMNTNLVQNHQMEPITHTSHGKTP